MLFLVFVPSQGFWVLSLVLLKKKIAVPLFLVSLVTVFVVQGYWMLGTQAIALLGTEAIIMPMLVIVTSIFLYFYCKGARQNNWLL